MKVMELTSGNLGVPICKMDHHHWFSHSSRQPHPGQLDTSLEAH